MRVENTRGFIELAEDAAMNKVMDIHKDLSLKRGFVRFDPKDPSRDRLKDNLLYLESVESIAQSNENFFLSRPVENSFEGTILMHHRLPQKIPREEVYTILIRNGQAQGIVILDTPPSGIRFYDRRIVISKCVDFNSTTTQEAVRVYVQEMLFIYKDTPNLCVPVYGLSGSIYWPFEAKYSDLKRYFAGDQDEI